jgi:hypothetical protein
MGTQLESFHAVSAEKTCDVSYPTRREIGLKAVRGSSCLAPPALFEQLTITLRHVYYT